MKAEHPARGFDSTKALISRINAIRSSVLIDYDWGIVKSPAEHLQEANVAAILYKKDRTATYFFISKEIDYFNVDMNGNVKHFVNEYDFLDILPYIIEREVEHSNGLVDVLNADHLEFAEDQSVLFSFILPQYVYELKNMNVGDMSIDLYVKEKEIRGKPVDMNMEFVAQSMIIPYICKNIKDSRFIGIQSQD